jgi:tetratricopeptide (TPR) repeat protein
MQARATRIAAHVSAAALLLATAGATARAADDAARLERRMYALHEAGRDDAALAAAERLVQVVERDRAYSKDVTARAMCNMAFCALCAGRPEKALAASERGLAIAPDLLCHKNRAHALLFLGRTVEARSVYLDHKGERVGRRRWEVFVSQDFGEFRRRGLDRPGTAEIERALASARESPRARATGDTLSAGEAELKSRDLCFSLYIACTPGCPDDRPAEDDCHRTCRRQEQECLAGFSRIIHGR